MTLSGILMEKMASLVATLKQPPAFIKQHSCCLSLSGDLMKLSLFLLPLFLQKMLLLDWLEE